MQPQKELVNASAMLEVCTTGSLRFYLVSFGVVTFCPLHAQTYSCDAVFLRNVLHYRMCGNNDSEGTLSRLSEQSASDPAADTAVESSLPETSTTQEGALQWDAQLRHTLQRGQQPPAAKLSACITSQFESTPCYTQLIRTRKRRRSMRSALSRGSWQRYCSEVQSTGEDNRSYKCERHYWPCA